MNELAIEKIGERLERDAKFALQAAGAIMQSVAYMYAPKAGQHLATGDMANSIYLDTNELESDLRVVLRVGTDHATYNEYGTGPKGATTWKVDDERLNQPFIPTHHGGTVTRSNPRTGTLTTYETLGMNAHPFMRPALEAGERALKEALSKIMK